MRPKRCVKKKRCMLTDSLHTHFNQDMYSRGEMVMDHDARHGHVVKDLLVYFIRRLWRRRPSSRLR